MTHSYKLGDKVRILNTDWPEVPSQRVGQIREIITMNSYEEGVWVDYPEVGDVEALLYYLPYEIEPAEAEREPEMQFEIPHIEVEKRLRIEPFVLETPSCCTIGIENGDFGGVSFDLDEKDCFDVIDLRHFAATLNALADKMEEADNV